MNANFLLLFDDDDEEESELVSVLEVLEDDDKFFGDDWAFESNLISKLEVLFIDSLNNLSVKEGFFNDIEDDEDEEGVEVIGVLIEEGCLKEDSERGGKEESIFLVIGVEVILLLLLLIVFVVVVILETSGVKISIEGNLIEGRVVVEEDEVFLWGVLNWILLLLLSLLLISLFKESNKRDEFGEGKWVLILSVEWDFVDDNKGKLLEEFKFTFLGFEESNGCNEEEEEEDEFSLFNKEDNGGRRVDGKDDDKEGNEFDLDSVIIFNWIEYRMRYEWVNEWVNVYI